MKQTVHRISLALLALSMSVGAAAWGRLGHATIAEIAQRHLTPEAARVIDYYTGGAPLATWASWMDEVAGTEPYKTEFAGWHASICDPSFNSPLYLRKARRNCRDGVTAMEFFRECLKDYESMPDSVVLQAIKCMTHIVGDFHCPAHVRYTDEKNELKHSVEFFGKQAVLHAVWDTGIIQKHSGLVWKDYREYADRLDTWDSQHISSVTGGWAREWFEDCARDVRPYIRTVPAGAVLGQEFIAAHIGLAELEIRKAGYQLAKALNTIFGSDHSDGLWFLDKRSAISRSGMVEGDAIVFSRPVDVLPKGTWVQFGVSVENTGEKAPEQYAVEFLDGDEWVKEGSFFTVSASQKHPTTYLTTDRLRNTVSDTLKVRCRVCSGLAADGSKLSADEPGNSVEVKKKHYVGAVLKPLGSAKPSREKSVLLIGNSFTYYFGEPFMLQEIAFSQGLKLDVHASLKGGQTFRQHCGLEMSVKTASQTRYDYAFIQGQSQEPAQYAANPDGHKDVADAYGELVGIIRGKSPKCRIYVENTWAYPALSNGGFGSLEEFDRMLSEGCNSLAALAGTEKSLVGQAFAKVPEMGLLHRDDKHPGLSGAYLKACVTYLTISGRPFKGHVPSCGLSEHEAIMLRAVAEATVLK